MQYKRKKVTCFTKDNILKMTDGSFHKIYDEISAEYPSLEKEHWIVDIGAAKLADTPEAFDVIVMPNLYGDVLSDVAAQIAGSVGLAGSSNIGAQAAMFEAIHGSAPRARGTESRESFRPAARRSLMLVHIGQADVGERIHNAWIRTLEDGVHTYDIFQEGLSKQKGRHQGIRAGCSSRLGQKPQTIKAVEYSTTPRPPVQMPAPKPAPKTDLVGVDVYVEWPSREPKSLAAVIGKASGDG
jgi:isocitrate dehydrogenase